MIIITNLFFRLKKNTIIWKSTTVALTFLEKLENTVEMNCQKNSAQRTIS